MGKGFVDNVRFATVEEILAYMKSRGFKPQDRDGVFSDVDITC